MRLCTMDANTNVSKRKHFILHLRFDECPTDSKPMFPRQPSYSEHVADRKQKHLLITSLTNYLFPEHPHAPIKDV